MRALTLAILAACNLIHLVMASETPLVNTRWVLARRPVGAFDPALDAARETAPLPKLEAGQVVVKVEVLSVDAFLRTMLDAEAYHGAIAVGDALPALGYGTVVAAADDVRGKIGSRVLGMTCAQAYAVGKCGAPDGFMPMVKVPGVPETAALGLLSVVTGVAAYVGCFKVLAPPRRGETAVVSAAGGAVGSVAVQLLKSTGARVVGVAGGATKGAFCRDTLGCDAVVDYKAPSFAADLDAACPNGVDFFFDNAGGETLALVLDRLNLRSRVVVCGAASQYSGKLNRGRDKEGRGGAVEGPRSYLKLAEKSSQMAGFNVMHYFSSIPLALANLCWMYWRGTVAQHEQIEDGLDAFPAALQKLFSGGHCGKLLVKL